MSVTKPVTPPSSTFDFSSMGFQYRDINGYVKYIWTEENGWSKGTMETDAMLNVHMCATGLNYGQQVIVVVIQQDITLIHTTSIK